MKRTWPPAAATDERQPSRVPARDRRHAVVRTLLEQTATLSDDAVADARARVHANPRPPAVSLAHAGADGPANPGPDLAAIDETVFRAWAEARRLRLPPTSMIPESVIEAFVAEQRHLMGLPHQPPSRALELPTTHSNPVVVVVLPEGTLYYREWAAQQPATASQDGQAERG